MGRASAALPLDETLVAQVYFGWPDELRDPAHGLSPAERAEVQERFLADASRDRDRFLEAARRLDGVRHAAAGSRFPGDESERLAVQVEGAATRRRTSVETVRAGSGWFELLAVRPLHGRLWRKCF